MVGARVGFLFAVLWSGGVHRGGLRSSHRRRTSVAMGCYWIVVFLLCCGKGRRKRSGAAVERHMAQLVSVLRMLFVMLALFIASREKRE